MKPNTSRKVFDWLKRMVMALILLIGFFATAGMIYQTAATEADQRLNREIVDARVLGGMHLRHSLMNGAQLGRKVAKNLVKNFFRKVP